jgi:isohexenylglutaconyl-CoA hydratase
VALVRVERDGGVWRLTLNRPERRNAMSLAMLGALGEALDEAEAGAARVVVLRGEGGHFCAGGDIADMQAAAAKKVDVGTDPIATMNRRFGTMLERVEALPFATVSVCEGGVMGGGFGLACVTDVTLASPTARFRLPETSLGISPAQIAPFVVQRLGLSQARRLAVTGETLGADQAVALGLAHLAPADVDAALGELLPQMLRCEPGAVRATKALVRSVGAVDLGPVLDRAADDFAALARRPEAAAGMMAFLQREAPPWAR